MLQSFHMAGMILAATLLIGAQTPQQRAADFLARFARESDPLRKAKMMPQYGDAQFQKIQDAIEEGNIAQAVVDARNYRDQAQACAKSLDAKVADPEKHSGGFKQLQISLRQALRRLEDIVVRLNNDDNKPFIEVRNDLEELDRHLVRELFPLQPGGAPQAPRPQS